MAWLFLFIVAWLFVIASLYTWYRAVVSERAIREYEKKSKG